MFLATLGILLLAGGSTARASDALTVAGPAASTWRLEVTDRLRGEFVDWFKPRPHSPTPRFRYDFVGERFQGGLRVLRAPIEAFLQYQHTVIGGLPNDGVGVGATYFANTRSGFQEAELLREGWVRGLRQVGGWTVSLTTGRQLYADGAETAAGDLSLRWLEQERLAARLIGPFEYTDVGRSFDGVRAVANRPAVNLTGFAFHPTSGGFAIHGGHDLASIDLAGLSATFKPRPGLLERTEGRVFWIFYADDRPRADRLVVTDNRPLRLRQRDRAAIAIHTLGANAARVQHIGLGQADVLLWAAGQVGDWQSLAQRAWAYAAEVGYRLPALWASPWLRAGFFRGSGDGNPRDSTHGTFFQLLPTARQYAQFPFYNLMNNQDTFVQGLFQPWAPLGVRCEFHWLRVGEARDLFYSGGGATEDDVFGYVGLPTGGSRQIGYVTDVALTYRALGPLTLYAYYGHAFGQDVIGASFAGRDANYGYLEATVAF